MSRGSLATNYATDKPYAHSNAISASLSCLIFSATVFWPASLTPAWCALLISMGPDEWHSQKDSIEFCRIDSDWAKTLMIHTRNNSLAFCQLESLGGAKFSSVTNCIINNYYIICWLCGNIYYKGLIGGINLRIKEGVLKNCYETMTQLIIKLKCRSRSFINSRLVKVGTCNFVQK